MTEHSVGVDDAGGVTDRKTTTTVAMDFEAASPFPARCGCTSFGNPGQDRFLFMWDDLVRGAIGAVVLVDTERLDQCFPAVDYFEGPRNPVHRVCQLLRRRRAPPAGGRARLWHRPRGAADVHGRPRARGDQAGADRGGPARHEAPEGRLRHASGRLRAARQRYAGRRSMSTAPRCAGSRRA